MTTFHDQPPLSRRAARERERDARQTSPGTDYLQFLTPEQEEAARLERERERDRPTPGSRRASREAGSVSDIAGEAPPIEIAAPPAYRVRDFSPDGSMTPETAPPPLVEPPVGTPVALDYRTIGVPETLLHPSEAQVPLPAAAAPAPLTRRELRMRELAEAGQAAQAAPDDAPAPRSSGFADTIAQFEALRRAQAPAGPAGTPVDVAATATVASEEVVVAEIAPESVALGEDEVAAEQGVVDEPAVDEPAVEELAVVEPSPADEFVESFAEAFEEAPTETTDDAPAAAAPWNSLFDVSTLPPPGAPSAADRVDLPPPVFDAVVEEPADTSTPTSWPFEFTQTQPPVLPQFDDDVEEDPIVAVVEPVAEGTVADATDLAPEFVEPPVVRESYTPPVGHWTRQAELDDDLPFENTFSREVGGGHSTTTTSALILPSIPVPDFSSIINATGEIMVTGTIDLPQGLSTMGAESHQLDDSSVDAMFEAADKELVSNDSQPVRAIRAVSTHTSTRGVIAVPTKPQSNRWLKVAVVAACVLAVSVVAFLGVYVLNTL